MWGTSRAGARAGRGFHYQHLVVVNVLLLQWANKIEIGSVVPEGLEDFTLESNDIELWVQIKSKLEGNFSQKQANDYLELVKEKSKTVICKTLSVKELLILEQECSNQEEKTLEHIFDPYFKIFIARAPESEAINLLVEKLEIADIVASGIVAELYKLVADCSQKNAKLNYENREKISFAHVEEIINNVLSYSDFNLVDKAILNRTIKLIRFDATADSVNFYKGVKARPRHISSGLAIIKSDVTKELSSNLENQKSCLIIGPSGAGKSTLLWAAVLHSFDTFRWFELSSTTTIQDLDSILSFVSSRRTHTSNPIALAFDEINAQNYEVWNLCLQHFSDFDDLYILGSIRAEDLHLINSLNGTHKHQLSLDKKTAEFIWKNLSNTKNTDWQHWLEPYNKSNGLMLEYIHILTQGSRLKEIIAEQVNIREKQSRYNELAIIRISSEVSSHGGEIDTQKLQSVLDIQPQQISIALKRLLDEHLIHEKKKGVLGGLHDIRSKALSMASHDGIIFSELDSLISGIKCATYESIPSVIHSVFQSIPESEYNKLMSELAMLLSSNNAPYFWIGVLRGLGLVTLERSVNLLIGKLERYRVRRSIWNTVSMFAVADIDPPKLSDNDHWQSVIDCLDEYRKEPQIDYRLECLNLLTGSCLRPELKNLEESSEFLSCFIPFYNGATFPTNFNINITHSSGSNSCKICDLADFLLSAYKIKPELALSFIEKLGGTDSLLNLYHSQSSWLTKPEIINNGNHGVTVCSNIHFIGDDEAQADFNKMAVENCKVLIALSPESEAAECRTIWPNGESIKVGDHCYYDKNMPRKNIPAKDKVEWNVAFQKIMSSKASINRGTDYAVSVKELLNKTEKLFRTFSEQWIRGKSISNKEQYAEQFNQVITSVNDLNYVEQQTAFQQFGKGEETLKIDRLTGVISGLLSNLSTRMGKVTFGEKSISEAVYAGDLAQDFMEQKHLKVWSLISSSPINDIEAISQRVQNISYVLHEMNCVVSPIEFTNIIKAARKAPRGKAIATTARFCRENADKRLRKLLSKLKNDSASNGCMICFEVKEIEKKDTVYWPPVEISILIKIEDLFEELSQLDVVLNSAKTILKNDWIYSVTPIVKGYIVPSLSIKPTFNMPLPMPYTDFIPDWEQHSKYKFFESRYQKCFQLCMSSVQSLSLIVAVRDLSELTEEESEVVERLKHSFNNNLEAIEKLANTLDVPELYEVTEFIHNSWNEMVDASSSFDVGQMVNESSYLASKAYFAGELTEGLQTQAVYGLLLLQAELAL